MVSQLCISHYSFLNTYIYFCKTGEATQSRYAHNLQMASSTARVDWVSAASECSTRERSFPNLCLLVELIIYISGSNSSVERAFEFCYKRECCQTNATGMNEQITRQWARDYCTHKDEWKPLEQRQARDPDRACTWSLPPENAASWRTSRQEIKTSHHRSLKKSKSWHKQAMKMMTQKAFHATRFFL